jgi:hypothetical protein
MPDVRTVYNLEVAEFHTYFVGAAQLWVHNACNCGGSGEPKADFVVGPEGTAVPTSQSRMRQGFDAAGFPSTPSTKTAESGVIHTVPSKGGPIDVRTMEGSAHHPRRAVTTRSGTNDPVKITGEKFTGNVPKAERRAGSHLSQEP